LAIPPHQSRTEGTITSLPIETLEQKVKLGLHGGDRGNQHTGGKRQGDNVTLPNRGTSSAYILARLDRDGHAELAARVRAASSWCFL
jgi:hypothetical protein